MSAANAGKPVSTAADLLYSDVEDSLRASVRGLLAERAPWASVLARCESTAPYDPALWTALARDLGAAGLAVPEADAGQGATWREAAVVAEELGSAVTPTPFLGSAVIATAMALALGASDVLQPLASGTATAAVAVPLTTMPGTFPSLVKHTDGVLSGSVRSVADAADAEHLFVPASAPDGPAIVLVDATDTRRDPVTSLDLTRPLCDITLDGARGRVLAEGPEAVAALERALTIGAALLASEQLGLAQRCLDLTVDYLKGRYQFGRPLASFQALKHRLADLWAAVTQARAVARYAAACAATGDPDLAVAAGIAQAYCSPMAVKAAEECVQLHGGIGFTWEHPAHLYLKRAKADSLALGPAHAHRARLATLTGLPAT